MHNHITLLDSQNHPPHFTYCQSYLLSFRVTCHMHKLVAEGHSVCACVRAFLCAGSM